MRKTIVIIITSISVLILFLIKNRTTNNLLVKENSETLAVLDKEKSLATKRDYFLSLHLKSNGALIEKELSLKNYKGEEFALNNKLTSKKLIFRYSELHCDECVDQQIESLKKYKERIGNENILILADYANINNLILFKRLNSIEIPVYRLSKKMNLKLEEKDVPYFFVIDSSFTARDFFIPIKEIDGYTDNYLNIISEKHFNNKG